MDFYTANTLKVISIIAMILFLVASVILFIKKGNKKFAIATTILTAISIAGIFYFQHAENNPKLSTASDHPEVYNLPESSSNESSESSSETSSTANSSDVESDTESTSTSTSKVSSSSSSKAKSSQEELADKLPKNVEYGYINKDDFTKETMYHSKEFDYVYVSTGDYDIIKTVKLDFKDLPLASLDDALEYIQDWTSRDTQLQIKVDDRTYIYHSASLNLDYKIKLVINSQGEISRVSIFPDDSLV